MMNALEPSPFPSNSIRAEIVTSAEKQAHAYAVRAICFLEDRGLPFGQDFDANDYDATHVIMYSGNEPIGAARLRWFNGFVKWERSCFRPKYRNMDVIRTCEQDIIDHIARRGIPLVLTYAQEPFATLWVRRLKWERTGRLASKADGTRELHELRKFVPSRTDAITPDSDPSLLHRIVGDWDTPASYG